MRYVALILTLLLALVAQGGVAPSAMAQASSGCSANSVPGDGAIPTYCDQGIAYAACAAAEDAAAARLRSRYPESASDVQKYGCAKWSDNVFKCYVRIAGVSEDDCRVDNKLYSFYKRELSCNARNASMPLADAAPWYSAPSTCVGGCKVGGIPFSQDNGGVKVYGMSDRYYDGTTCAPQNGKPGISPEQGPEEEAKPKPNECVALGSGQTSCVKPNGDHCTTASTGKTFCWQPHESGEKRDGTDAQTKSETGKPVMPPTSTDPSKEYQRTEGHQQTACVNSTCVSYNVTNFTATGKGSAKNGTGDNSVDGSKNTSGNGQTGTGNGGGGKEGEKDSANESGNCEQPPTCVGDTLKCLHLKFTWKIECNTKGNMIEKGDGCGEGDVPVCAGSSCKAEAYSQVLQQWKARCAAQAVGEGLADRAAGISNPDDAGVVDGIWIKEGNGNGPKLRQDLVNVGASGGSLLPDVSIEGHKWEVPSGFYDAIANVRMVIIAMCTVLAMFIVGRNI
ncbi:A coat protein [Stenotrophomonas maltophilia]|uniref:A coat protein n=1 Tax=Stenotrophomonas maltophilia TaxID=40324 RepID=UPI0011B69C04|nr:A coat protein [Stenotrophomonas maltophilia]